MKVKTGYRDKLPRNLSYPVSSSTISELLSHVDLDEELHVNFAFRKTAKNNRSDQRESILTASYTKNAVRLETPNSHLEEGHFLNTYSNPRWVLRVYAITHEELTKFKKSQDDGLANLKKWFHDSITNNGKIGHATFSIFVTDTGLDFQQQSSLLG